MKQVMCGGLVLTLVLPVMVSAVSIAPRFSIDPASPAINGNITPDDVLTPGPIVLIQGNSLGLQDSFFTGVFDNLDALSFGKDPIRNPLFFSVDRVAVGLPNMAVFAQAQPGVASAAGDVYVALPPFGSNRLVINETQLGLTPGFFGDDLAAVELDTTIIERTYFSIDALSASNGFGADSLANDIFIDTFPGIFASGELHIGLAPGDDLDALVLDDTFQPGVLNPGIDQALFSLSTFSPSTFTLTGNPYVPCVRDFLSPADICFTDFTGGFSLWASAADIGLRPDDNVDALDTVVPEPATFVLLAFGLVGLVVYQYCFRSHRES